MTRRDLLKILLATPAALTLDYEKLLWVPKPIIVVPELPLGLLVAQAWEDVIKKLPIDLFDHDAAFYENSEIHFALYKKFYEDLSNKRLD